MELFFEDVEIDSQSLAIDDVTGLISISLESEMAWNNLERTIMHEEFNALLNEATNVDGKSKESIFKRMIAVFKEMIQRFKIAVRDLYKRMELQYVNAKRVLAMDPQALKNFQPNGDFIKQYDWKLRSIQKINSLFLLSNINGTLSNMVNQAIANNKAMTVDELAVNLIKSLNIQSFASMSNDIMNPIRNGNEVKEIKITKEMVNNAIVTLEKAQRTVYVIKDMTNLAEVMMQSAVKFATDGLNASDEVIERKKLIGANTTKNAMLVLNKLINLFTKITVEYFSDGLKVVRYVIINHPTPKEKKETKNESVKVHTIIDEFNLSLEDFT